MSNSMSAKLPKGKTGFITKLQSILSNQQLSSVVGWSYSGNSFLILDAGVFESRVLSNYFRHKRMSSFIRQLNMYGFHKQRSEKDALEFYHPFFKKERPDLFAFIERKKVSQLSFKENQPEAASKESQSELFFSEKYMLSIKVIEPEQEWNNQPSFRFNGSKMTIKLNAALTSLCEVEYDEEIVQDIQMDGMQIEPYLQAEHQRLKNGEFQHFFLPLDEQERQINFL